MALTNWRDHNAGAFPANSSNGVNRKFSDWLEGWEKYVINTPSPTVFRRWTGIATVAGAMERKCWVRTFGRPFYPNLFIVLVSPPGVGKSFLIEIVKEFWLRLGTHHTAPDSVSRASLADELREAERHVVRIGETTYTFNSLLIAAEELGTLIPTYDTEFMNTLNKLYDCSRYGERKRGSDLKYTLEKPQINLLSGTQPSYLQTFLPEGAWEQGFMSRAVLVYSGENITGDLFAEDVLNEKLGDDLIHDLKVIGSVHSAFTWAKEAADVMQQWYKTRGPPVPDHPKLTHYCTRRYSQILKLCQVASIIESDEMVITVEHFQRAVDWLTEAENYMPDIFKAMAQGGDAQIIKECWYFVYKLYIKKKEPIREFRIIRFLQDRTPSHNVERILLMMVKGELLKLVSVNKIGPCYIPLQLT